MDKTYGFVFSLRLSRNRNAVREVSTEERIRGTLNYGITEWEVRDFVT